VLEDEEFPPAVRRLAMLSLHTSPLAQAGSADAGGMNVYVRELVSALAQGGVDCTTYVRRWSTDLPREILVEPGFRVVHIDAGPFDLAKEALPEIVDDFADGVMADLDHRGGADVVHANYWLSGLAGHRIKHERDIPLVTTSHTLARVKAEGGDPEPLRRERAEAGIIGCADAICMSCTEEESQFRRLYGNPPGRVEIVAPGVDHAFFAPGDRRGARSAIGLGSHPVLLFVGRIQPLKGADVAVRALASLRRPDAVLLIVGGASGLAGDGAVAELKRLVDDLGVTKQVRFVAPQPHHLLSTYYRAADVVLVPSRSESFGLVALEAAACGTPVVAAAVGGLLTLVDHGHTGFLVVGRDPDMYAAYTAEILDHPFLADSMSRAAALRARRYTWTAAAGRLRRLYMDLSADRLVECR
jgi:D-inositol-3-phosphate glycosyltransferase